MIDLETAKAETRMHLLLASHHLFWLQHALRFKIRQQYLLHDRRTMHLAESRDNVVRFTRTQYRYHL